MKRTPMKAATKSLKRTTPLRAKKSTLQRTAALTAKKTTLATSKELKRTNGIVVRKPLVASTPMKRQTTPLLTKVKLEANPLRIREAKAYHDAVFAEYGSACVLCARPHPATHAAHVIKRSTLGRLRYASVRFARPAHPDCHQRQEANLITFSAAIRRSATLAYNALTRNSKKLVPDA